MRENINGESAAGMQGMDFSRIHRSGVSTILLKGERYTAPPNMRRIELMDRWHWAGDTIYLDASCLLFGRAGRHIEAVDYSYDRSAGTMRQGAVRHSGDVMDAVNRTGTHTISVVLDDLGEGLSDRMARAMLCTCCRMGTNCLLCRTPKWRPLLA